METKITKPMTLKQQDKKLMLKMARESLNHYLNTSKLLNYDEEVLPESLLESAGVFVSLHKNKALRGCIGQLESNQPLYQTIQKETIAAATRDSRFPAISYEELSELSIEISVLSRLEPINSIRQIEPGKHGIYIRKGHSTGTFLPQVAQSTGWNKEELLGYCARDKAGIGWDGWKTADIFVYTAEVFSE